MSPAYPPVLIMEAALIIGIAILSTALMQSDLQYREESVIDPLTGTAEPEGAGASGPGAQPAVADRPTPRSASSAATSTTSSTSTIGTDTRPAISSSNRSPTVIRGQLRAFELAYRIGGEEFLILIPGLGLAETAELAERLRVAVAAQVYANGIRVTMSIGVTKSTAGPALDFTSLSEGVDAALYEAKREGRNQVRIAGVAVETVADPGLVGSGAGGAACRAARPGFVALSLPRREIEGATRAPSLGSASGMADRWQKTHAVR